MSGICGTNYMRYKWKEVWYPVYPCCKQTEVKEIPLHQLQCTFLPRIWISKEIMDALQQWKKGKYTEESIVNIICCYIKWKGRKVCQDAPNLPMELSSVAKPQDDIGWNIVM